MMYEQLKTTNKSCTCVVLMFPTPPPHSLSASLVVVAASVVSVDVCLLLPPVWGFAAVCAIKNNTDI